MSESVESIQSHRPAPSLASAEARPAMADVHSSSALTNVAWWVGVVLLVLWSAWHLGATELTATVQSMTGTGVTVPNTFATVDHPYHVARAQTLLESLKNGQILRWVGSHEGGYPVEFYPLGIPWLTVGVWALLLGTVPIAAAAKLVVIGVFLAPVIAFAALGRRTRVALPVAGLGLVAHLAVPGEWWSGGYTETIEWGLITNVAAYISAFGFLAALLSFALRPSRLALVAGIGLGVFAVATNTRSVIALACVVIGVIVSVLIERGWAWPTVGRLIARLAVVGIPSVLLATPLWLSSLRFGDLYEFIRYRYYADLGAYWTSSVNAISWPVMILALVGFVIAVVAPGRVAPRAAAWTLVSYVVATLVLGGLGSDGGLVAQLEATRLMPFQRLLMIYLAATAVVEAFRFLGRWMARPAVPASVLVVATVLLATIFVVRPPGSIPLEQRSMFPVETTASPQYADLLAAVRTADAAAPAGTAIFIAGSELGWHQPMWAPLVTDRPLRYTDWLWLWQTWHRTNALDYDGQAIAPGSIGMALRHYYLAQEGIGTVIALTPQLEALADRSPDLQRLPGSGYAVYRVQNPTPIVSIEGSTVEDPSIENQRVSATIDGPGGTVTVSETWFPRWVASVNGESVAVERDDRGRMTVVVPPGRVSLELHYGVDRLDVLARVAAVVGLLLTVLLVVWTSGFRAVAMAGPARRETPPVEEQNEPDGGLKPRVRGRTDG